METRTIDERIEAACAAYKESLREKMKAVMTIEGPNKITLDGLELLWGQANKEAEQMNADLFNDIVNNNLQDELLSKKKTELKEAGYNVVNRSGCLYTVFTLNGDAKFLRTKLRTQIRDDETGEVYNWEICVLDDYFGIKHLPHKASKGLTGELAWWAQHEGSYEQAATILCNKIGIKVSDEFIRTIAMEVGQLVYEDNTKKALAAEHLDAQIPPQATKEGILYVDGSFIRTREKNADGSSAWKEVKLAMVFNDNDMKVQSNGKKQYITKKAYAVSTEDHEEFSKYLNETAVSCGYGKYEKTIVISDGATWIRNRCKEVFPDGLQILDFYHLCEQVNDAGKALFNNNPKKYEPWVDTIVSLLRQSETNQVLDLLSNDAKTHSCIEKLCTYITNNIDKVDYAAYESAGYLIGSGSIESANKVVVQQRCKRTGQRWNVPTAQLMLSLRAVEESGKWPCLIPSLLAAA